MFEVEELQLIALFHLAKIGLLVEHSNPGLEKKMRCNKEEAAEGTKMKQATLIIVGNFFHFPRCASFGTVFIRPRKLSTLI